MGNEFLKPAAAIPVERITASSASTGDCRQTTRRRAPGCSGRRHSLVPYSCLPKFAGFRPDWDHHMSDRNSSRSADQWFGRSCLLLGMARSCTWHICWKFRSSDTDTRYYLFEGLGWACSLTPHRLREIGCCREETHRQAPPASWGSSRRWRRSGIWSHPCHRLLSSSYRLPCLGSR